MQFKISHAALAQAHAASLCTQLALRRWQGQPARMPQAAHQAAVQRGVLSWLQKGGFTGQSQAPATKTAAKGRRSLASHGDSMEEYKFSLLRIHDAAQ